MPIFPPNAADANEVVQWWERARVPSDVYELRSEPEPESDANSRKRAAAASSSKSAEEHVATKVAKKKHASSPKQRTIRQPVFDKD
jgi:hypothetical protein